MTKHFDIQTSSINDIVVHIYRSSKPSQDMKRLFCIHGAGVAGRTTFDYIIHYLSSYDEVLVPDLPGMGESPDTALPTPTIADYMSCMISTLNHCGWKQFDLCGYSLGGLIAAKLIESNEQTKQFAINNRTLIEPALFDDSNINRTRDFRQQYKNIANKILNEGDIQENILSFLDLVSPNRSKNPRADNLAIRRLGQRPKGFAQALHAVAEESEIIDRDSLIEMIQPVTVIAGQNSYPKMLDFHTHLSQQQANWSFVLLPSCDHSIPYQKPRRVAEILDN
ncbi:alpha/beta hydrolase [Bermanella marisrubri]|uniref:3-oxoadipate enol-lactone hydrolase/4-carboxymuconolactone decarboxylase n=1 Tax=Bermanella marisrubri TaxID=207949 RepID=Q1MXZ6_9GAMM|nr:alpha/beta hydrolase [Bermanella marisrubri]EAT10833.1 3-oxoadipate enol-lactone hydrolase/4-carboxymuconolactone decarboxylase [Oceanobacter sp. RED65] [Bermanella marisrubri]QIZ84215.1 alpha/beta hydrolase [Bermanella marisrubri]